MEPVTMRIRTDLTAFSLTGLCVVALVALAIAGQPVPELLNQVTLVSLGVSGGAVVPTVLGPRTAPPQEDLQLDALELGPAAGRSPVSAPDVVPAPAPAVEHVPGRDMTETFPAITPEQIAAHRAGRQ
jgi:hypothetical protein